MPVYSIHMPIQSLPLQPLVLGFTYGVTSRTEVANRLFVWVAFELRVLNHTHTHTLKAMETIVQSAGLQFRQTPHPRPQRVKLNLKPYLEAHG